MQFVNMGCDQYQGYHFSAPGTAASIETMMRASLAPAERPRGVGSIGSYTEPDPLSPV